MNNPLRSSAKAIVLPLLGAYDFVKPPPREAWQGPFNKQHGRQAIFNALLAACRFRALIETGTFRGDTTQYMHATSGLRVYSAELYPRFYWATRLTLRGVKGIELFQMDSVSFLHHLKDRQLVPDAGLFFYLDAHWYRTLPARDEAEFIFATWPDSVVMVDDFKVPGDDGYRYDDYKDAGVLSAELITKSPSLRDVRLWFPAMPSHEESGAVRGSVVLTRAAERHAQLAKISELREYKGR